WVARRSFQRGMEPSSSTEKQFIAWTAPHFRYFERSTTPTLCRIARNLPQGRLSNSLISRVSEKTSGCSSTAIFKKNGWLYLQKLGLESMKTSRGVYLLFPRLRVFPTKL